jgi:hypothetical protein
MLPSSIEAQCAALKTLLQDRDFALEMARWIDSAYYHGLGREAPPFVEPGMDEARVGKPALEEKIAINLAAFYALEAGLGYLAETSDRTPVQILSAIVDKSLPDNDMLLLARFANATWKASQPFRSLARIERGNFCPAVMLPADELDKDFVQIEAAATKLLEAMSRSGGKDGL